MSRKKILVGIIGKGNGGLSTYAVRLSQQLDPALFECTFLSNAPHPYFEQDIEKMGGKIKVIAPRSQNPKGHREDLRRIMGEERFDVCHIHLSSDSNICPLQEAKRAGIPLVIAHCHSAKVEGSPLAKILHCLNKGKVQKMDMLRLACSRAAGDFAYGNAPYTVVNNGIDLQRFSYRPKVREELQKRLGISGRFVVGQLGRLAPVKNHEFTLRLFSEVLKERPQSSLLIVGDGPLRQQLTAQAKELGLEDQVIFTGNVPNPEDYLCAMDCMMAPSLFEGFPLTIVEAVATGLCCFVSDTVTREVGISDLVRFFSLGSGPKAAAQMVLKAAGRERDSQEELLKSLHFDANELVLEMQRRYLSPTTGGE